MAAMGVQLPMKRIVILHLLIIISAVLRADALPENTLKAAYLYNFALLTDWPKGEKSTKFDLCFYREDLGSASKALQNKMVDERKINVMTVMSYEEIKGCDMLFIPENEGQSGQKMIRTHAGTSTLIISENPRFDDAHITIAREGRKLAFDISLKTLKESDLSLSSRLLKLARKVEP